MTKNDSINRVLAIFRTHALLLPGMVGLAAVIGAPAACAQASLPLYTDRLVNGFQDWSWGTRNFANSSPVHGGSTRSISASLNAWEAISLYHSDFDDSVYTNFSFWAHGGSTGGQRLQILGVYGTNSGGTYVLPSPLTAGTWQEIVVPLSSIGLYHRANANRISLQLRNDGTTATFYLDDLQLVAAPAPAETQISVNTTQDVRAVEARWFAVNTAIWDSSFDTASTVTFLNDMGTRFLRFPGGSLSDEYHWATGKRHDGYSYDPVKFANFVHVATNIGAQAFITVNYGTGTPEEAAAWVRHSNVTNQYGFRYWEIGNENYGSWETDTNVYPHDPYTYARRATNYIAQMKAADPTIRIGIVVAPGENSYSNVYSLNHPAVNPRTGRTNYGWTPILLSTLHGWGITPDFAVHHFYPEYTGQESDPLLLQAASNWARDAADLRQQLTDYCGASGDSIELVCTENNSNSGSQGKQSTSLVNGLYYADSLGQLMLTEFNAFVWWDLRNGTDTGGSMDATLYGWRTYGDLGMINGLDTLHPIYYAAKMMRFFAQPDETVLRCSSSYGLLSAYAVRAASGSVRLLVLNKDTLTNLTARIALNGFTPQPAATVLSFGIPQDEAAHTNGPGAARDIAQSEIDWAGPSFSRTFEPLSITLFTLTPGAPTLRALPPAAGGEFVGQLEGQPCVRYILERSSDLLGWTAVSTNTLSGSTLNFTNAAPPDTHQFWRAVWQP